jgi:hypothetical protein
MRWIEGAVSAAIILLVWYLTSFSTQISRVGMVQSYGWPFDSLGTAILVCTPVGALIFWICSRPKRF